MFEAQLKCISVKKLLINRNFALLWGGQIISVMGDYLFATIMVLWIATSIAHGQSWAPLAVSGLFIATSLPSFIIAPLAGVFVDRWDKRQAMLRTDGLSACITLLFLLLLIVPWITFMQLPVFWQIGLIYVFVFALSVSQKFTSPSLFALMNDVVEESQRTQATGLRQTIVSMGMIVGPPLATLLFFTVGIQWALLLNALSFAVSFLAALAVRSTTTIVSSEVRGQNNVLKEFAEGIYFFAHNRILMTILIGCTLDVMYLGILDALGIFFVLQNLHAPAAIYGFLGTASGLGLALGATLAAWLVQRIGITRAFWMGLIAEGLFVLLYARMTDAYVALAIMFLLNVAVAFITVSATPLLLHATPKKLIGRIFSMLNPTFDLCIMLSSALSGYLVSTILRGFHVSFFGITLGPIDTLLTIAGVMAIIAGLFAMSSLRGVKME